MPSWLTSQQCRSPWAAAAPPATATTFQLVQEWIAFITFAPCPQHILLSTLNLLFLAATLLLLLRRTTTSSHTHHQGGTKTTMASSTNSKRYLSFLLLPLPKNPGERISAGFACTLLISTGLTALAAAIAAFATWWYRRSSAVHPTTVLYVWTEAAAWMACVALLCRDASARVREYSMSLRTWWFCFFLATILQFLSAIFRFASSQASFSSHEPLLLLIDIYAVINFLASLYVFYRSVLWPSTGLGFDQHDVANAQFDKQRSISSTVPLLLHPEDEDLNGDVDACDGNDPLLQDYKGRSAPPPPESSNTISTGFAEASAWSKATFAWLTPVLAAGARQSLEMCAVPELAPRDRAAGMNALLRHSWPIPGTKHYATRPLTAAMGRAFWWQLALTAVLQLVRSVAMFGGPLLIPSFTSYAQGVYLSRYDGFSLVLFLLLSKLVEIVSYHQFNFQCYRLGNNMRTAIVTLLYAKSIRLSSYSRQAHGVGQITNYMVVDAQNVSDACLQIHILWAVPLQVVIAITVLYSVLGAAPTLAGLAALILVALSTAAVSQLQRRYQSSLMSARDTRLRAIVESLTFIKVIKLQAWENKFRDRIAGLRREEYGWLKAFVFATAANMFVLWNTQALVSAVTYLTAVLVGTPLTTSVVFTAASVFRIVQSPIRNFPQAIISLSQILVSLERLDRFMLSAELQPGSVIRSPNPTAGMDEVVVVEVTEGSFAWGKEGQRESEPTIRDVDLRIKKGSLVTVVGSVGAGKSSLLAALLGEMIRTSGKAEVKGSIAYVAQSAWIQNASIEENIRMGTPREDDYYERVVAACALVPDLAALDQGDQTEIGERGLNLSGGQKQRIQLARAVYQRSDIYLLDDVFSAVDAHTASHLFKECILGLLRGKTVVLVTHQIEFLAGADLVLFMKDGRIAGAGQFQDILSTNADFQALVAAHNQAMDVVVDHATSTMLLYSKEERPPMNMTPERASFSRIVSTEDLVVRRSGVEEMASAESFQSSAVDFAPGGSDGTAKLIEAEQRETGKVSLKVYMLYLTKAMGWGALLVLIVDQAIWQTLLVCSDFWISDEIPATADGGSYDAATFLRTYLLLNVSSWFTVLLRVMLVAAIGLFTAQLYFHQVLGAIFRAPTSFFDTTPSGRILSRFSSDQTNLDFMLHYYMGGCLGTYAATIGSVIVICISTWPIVFFLVPLALLYKWYQDFYLTSSREMTRLDAISKAPLIYHFSETVAGIETIRCFRKEEEFVRKNNERLDANMKMDFNNNSANEWLGLRLESIGTAVLTITGLLFVVLPANTIRPEYVGLALSYALALNIGLYWTVWLTCTLENKMVSVERLQQYTDIPSEAEFLIDGCLSEAPGWPDRGQIVCSRLKLRYREGTPLVLKGVSFRVEGGEKVGVVGRTGSGKSTLLLAVFRVVEAVAGQVCIDGIDIAGLGLHDLRSKLSIIPQDPVLFAGTVRTNLDPFSSFSDHHIWQVLEKCQLDAVVRDKPEKLDAPVTEYGDNWSVGQRQLLCFGRSLLKNSKVLFLDEATASMDARTDGIIQAIIRREFGGSTVVSIAHRIPTVMDADRVLVMDAGRVVEFERPSVLLSTPNSLFSSLVQEYKSRTT